MWCFNLDLFVLYMYVIYLLFIISELESFEEDDGQAVNCITS